MKQCQKCGKKYKLERNYLRHPCMREIKPFPLLSLPIELQLSVLDQMRPEDIWRSYIAGLPYFGEEYEWYWKSRFNEEVADDLKRKVKCGNWLVGYIAMKIGRCFRCMGDKTRYDEFYGFRVCFGCRKQYSGFKLITKTRAKKEYKLNDKDLMLFERIEMSNPYYKTSSNMVLFLEEDLKFYKRKMEDH